MKKLNHLLVISAAGLLLLTLLINWEKLVSYSVSASQLLSSSGQASSTLASPPGRLGQAQINGAYGRLPMSFELNQGQADPQVKYLARGRGYQVFLTETEAVLRLQSANQKRRSNATNRPFAEHANPQSQSLGPQSGALRIKVEGATPAVQITGLDLLPGKS